MNRPALPPRPLPRETADQKISDIQVLRGISILLVFMAHFSLTATILGNAPTKLQMPFYLGVEIFFIISGYVITRTLMKDSFNAVRFFVRRVFRLVPAILLFLAFGCLLNMVPRTVSFYAEYEANHFCTPWGNLLRQSVSVLCGYFILAPGPKPQAMAAMWSLSVEDQFYGVLALICLLAGLASRYRPQNTGKLIFWLSVLAYLAISLVRLTFLIKGHMQHVPWLLVYLTAWRFDFLAMGIMLAFLNRKWSRQICNLVGDAGPFLTPWLILLPLWIVSMCESPFAPEARILHGLGLLLCGFAFSALVLLAANSRAFPASRGAVYRFMVYLGDRSYTLYVFHFPVFVLTWLVFRARILNGMVLPLGGFAFMALVLLAAKSRAFPASRGAAYRLMVYLGDRNYTLYLFYFFVFVLAGLVCHKFLPSVFSSGIAYGLGQLILGSLLLWLQPPLRATAHYAVCP